LVTTPLATCSPKSELIGATQTTYTFTIAPISGKPHRKRKLECSG